MVNISPKLAILKARLASKFILKGLMQVPNHPSDQSIISNTINWYINNDEYDVLALDHNEYDHHVAGAKTSQIRDVLAYVLDLTSDLDSKAWASDSMYEMGLPKIFPFLDKILEYSGDGYLASGESSTTIHGITGNDISLFYALRHMYSKKGIKITRNNWDQYYGHKKDVFNFSWGDDTIFFFKKSLGSKEDMLAVLQEGFAKSGHSVEDEGNLRYLGRMYDIYQGSPVFRFVQSSLSGERVKDPYFYALGMIARYSLLDNTTRKFVEKDVLPELCKDIKRGYIKYKPSGVRDKLSFGSYTDVEITPSNLSNQKWRDEITKEALHRAEKVAGSFQDIDKIFHLFSHGSDDTSTIEQFLGVEDFDDFTGFTEESLTETINEHLHEGRMSQRLSVVFNRRHGPFLRRYENLVRKNKFSLADLTEVARLQFELSKNYHRLENL